MHECCACFPFLGWQPHGLVRASLPCAGRVLCVPVRLGHSLGSSTTVLSLQEGSWAAFSIFQWFLPNLAVCCGVPELIVGLIRQSPLAAAV